MYPLSECFTMKPYSLILRPQEALGRLIKSLLITICMLTTVQYAHAQINASESGSTPQVSPPIIDTVSDWNEVAIRVIGELKKGLMTRQPGGVLSIQQPFYMSHFETVFLEQLQTQALQQGLAVQLNAVGAAVVRTRSVITMIDNKQVPAWEPKYDRLTLTVDVVFEGSVLASTTQTYAILSDKIATYQRSAAPNARVIHLTNKASAP